MAKVIRFKVKGAGDFPLDCLRYDRCWPAVQEDARKAQYEYDLRVIELEGLEHPTVPRWESFGWRVLQ